MNRIRTWPHLAIIGLICLVVGAGAVLLWVKHEQSVDASALPNAARIDRVNGEVGLNRSLDNHASDTQWVNADLNASISVGDRVYTKDNADASIAFTGRNFVRLNADTSFDVLALSAAKTQVALRDGSAVFDIGSLDSGGRFEVATPCGAVDLTEPGLYQIEINDNGDAIATTLFGLAHAVSPGGSARIEKGEVLTVPCQDSSAATLSQVEPRAAGTLVDRYYSYRYPRSYDGRFVNYDSYLNDPFYYDPYRRFASYHYVSDYIPGVGDLDYYGDWQDVSGYGYCWRPRVDDGWAPYQSGYWTSDYPYGLTWISNEPWGYAPYHYGRWASVSNQWFWVPDRARTRPVYSPALVAFIPFEQTETIGWVPLAPGDPYAPRYYDQNWNPQYLTRTKVIQERVINLNVPGAVTVVNARDFNRVIDHRSIERVDPQRFAHVRPVLDPFAVRNFRDVAIRMRGVQRRFDVPAAVAQRIARPVVTSTTLENPFRRDLGQRFRAQQVPERARGQRLQFRDNRASAAAATQPELPQRNIATEQVRARQMLDLSREAARGNRAARQEMQQLQRQQRQEQQQQRAGGVATQQARGERVSNNAQTQRGFNQRPPRQRSRSQQPVRVNRGQQSIRGNANPRQLNQRPVMLRGPHNAGRPVQRRQPLQAQPRARILSPSNRQPANRQQRPRAQAAPQPQPVRQPRQVQPQPRPQPQVQRPPVQMRQQQPRSQPQPQPQPQNRKGRGRP